MEEIFFDYEGMSRSYLIYIPEKINLDVSNNLIVGLHGYTGTAQGLKKKQLADLIILQKSLALLLFILKVYISTQIKMTFHLFHHGMI